MAGDQLHQANGVPQDVFPPSIRPQPGRNHALQNVRVSFEHRDSLPSQVHVY